MRDLPPNMNLIIDHAYMNGMFREIETAKSRSPFGKNTLELSREQYLCVADILSYALEHVKGVLRQVTDGTMLIGAAEFGSKLVRMKGWTDLLSRSLVSFARDEVVNLTVSQIATTIAYMLKVGFLFVDLRTTENGKQCPDKVLSEFLAVHTNDELETVLGKYAIGVISPLLYSRLLVDLKSLVDHEMVDGTYGMLYEAAIKSEDIYRRGFAPIHYSYKYDQSKVLGQSLNEVDLVAYESVQDATNPCNPGRLLLEATIGRKVPLDGKGRTSHNIKNAYPHKPFTRVVTDKSRSEKRSVYHMLFYPLALLMLSNNTIFDLSKSTITIRGSS